MFALGLRRCSSSRYVSSLYYSTKQRKNKLLPKKSNKLVQVQKKKIKHDPVADVAYRASILPRIREKFGETSDEMQTTLCEMSILYQTCGEYHKAIDVLQQQKDIFVKEHGPIRFEYSSILHDIGVAYECLGEYDKAIEHLEESFNTAIHAVETFNTKPAEDLPPAPFEEDAKKLKEMGAEMESKTDPLLIGQIMVSRSAGALGSIYERKKDFEKAIMHYADAAINFPDSDLAYTTQSADHPHYCSLVNPFISQYTAHYFLEGRPAKIPEKFRDADDCTGIIESPLTPEVLEYAKEKAEDVHEALRVQETHIGSEHPALVPALANTGWTYLRAGNLDMSKDMWNRILSIERRVSGPFSARVATSLSSLAIIHYLEKDFKEAERLMLKAIRVKQKAYSVDKWLHIGLMKYDLGHIVITRDPVAGAEIILEAVTIFRRLLPNRTAGKRHAWYQLALDSYAQFGHGTDTASIPPTKDYNAKAEEQPNLYADTKNPLR